MAQRQLGPKNLTTQNSSRQKPQPAIHERQTLIRLVRIVELFQKVFTALGSPLKSDQPGTRAVKKKRASPAH